MFGQKIGVVLMLATLAAFAGVSTAVPGTGLEATAVAGSCDEETCAFDDDECVPSEKDRQCSAGCWWEGDPGTRECRPDALDPEGECLEGTDGPCCTSGGCTGGPH